MVAIEGERGQRQYSPAAPLQAHGPTDVVIRWNGKRETEKKKKKKKKGAKKKREKRKRKINVFDELWRGQRVRLVRLERVINVG
jgi:hypothetical protein